MDTSGRNSRDSVRVVRRFAASPEEVFAAWTRPALLERWAVDAASTDPRVGGRFRQETRSAEGLHVVSGEYREFVPNRRLLMTWNHEGPASAPDKTEALVTVDLREAGRAATELTVTEEPVAPDQRDDANAAWTGALDALEALLADASREA
jgi:uncharacterized protein YndB with AHSA1/START domain